MKAWKSERMFSYFFFKKKKKIGKDEMKMIDLISIYLE